MKISRLSALLVAMLMLVCCLPLTAFAETEVAITIPTLSEGATYEEGVSIPLMVDYNSDTSTISHVDFYADGVKIPGNLPADDTRRALMWSKPLPGTYKVTAKITYVGGGVAESAPVTISVLPGDEYVDVSRFDDADLSAWKLGSEQMALTEDMLSTDYADFSDKTLLFEDTRSLDSLHLFKDMNTQDYKYVNVLIHHFKNDSYNEETGYTYLPRLQYTLWREGNDLDNKPGGTWTQHSGPGYNTEEGWNRISLENGNMSFNSVIYGISNYPRSDEKGKVGYGVAIAGVFLSNTTSEAMTATPLIPDGQQNVSITMPGYRFNFNHTLNVRNIADKLAGVTMTSGDISVPVTYACGEEYLELRPKGNLALRKTYTVTIPEKTLCDNYGNYVPAQSFTFTTGAYSCAQADPIPYVTYPAEGDTVASEGVQLAAKVLFPVEDASAVKFYDNGTEIAGTVTRGTGSEFVMNNVSLSVGSHTITVKVTQDGKTFNSENSVTVTATNAGAYEVIGLRGNGKERVILNPQRAGYSDFSHKVTIIDKTQIAQKDDGSTVMENAHSLTKFYSEPTATGISQVIFDLDGVKTIDTTYPYEFPLTVQHKGKHTLSATILTVSGAVITKTIPFEGIVGSVAYATETDYNTYNEAELPFTGSNAWVAVSHDAVAGRVELSYGQSRNNASNGSTHADNSIWLKPDSATPLSLGDTKLAYVDFDIQKKVEGIEFQAAVEQNRAGSNGASTSILKYSNGSANAFSGTNKIHITLVADFGNGLLSAYANGVQINSVEASAMQNGTGVIDRLKLYDFNEGDVVYIDNYSIRSYSAAEDTDYAVGGMDINANLTANELGYKKSVSVHLTGDAESAGNLAKAVFKLGDKTVGTATSAPFSCDIPLLTLGNQTLTVETTDVFGVTKTITVPFAVQFKAGNVVAQSLAADAELAADRAAVANPGEATSYDLYEAVYHADDTLKSVTKMTVDISANEIKLHRAETALETGETVRLFTWTHDMKPLY